MNLLKSIAILVTGLFITSYAMAGDSIIVVKDARFDLLTSKQALINKRTSMMTSSGLYRGYRIQVLSTTHRDQAFKVKADLLSWFPDQKCYTLFQSPSFRVRIGNFLRKEDAEKFRKQLYKYYPQGVYVVEDAIEYIPKDEEEIVSQ